VRSVFLTLLLLLSSTPLQAIEANSDGSWVPVVEFQFGDADFSQTLNWVSGWSYALTAVAREQSRLGGPRLFCPTGRGHVESRILLTILNERFKGQRVTAEQASSAIWQGLSKHYPCPTAAAD
jgi:hypothetical protein